MKFSEYKQFFGELCPPNPTFTEKDYPDQSGRVCIVTGGPTGIGFHVSKYLLEKNAKVWIVARSQTKIDAAIEQFKKDIPNCKIDYFIVDFSDLATIKAGVQKFLDSESRLDLVIHNAGVMTLPDGSATSQGYELQLGVNCVGPHLLQKYLDEILIRTAQSSPENSVRVIWVSSNGHMLFSPKTGINWDDMSYKHTKAAAFTKYGQSKAINVYEAIQWPKKHPNSGVLSLSLHPGSLKSELQRHNGVMSGTIGNLLLFSPHMGAYTELYAALHPSFTTDDNGAYVIPWGRRGTPRSDVLKGANGEEGEKIWKWLEDEVAPFY